MRRRIGNTLTVKWEINTNGENVSLNNRDIKLYLVTPRSGRVPVDFTFNNNVVEYRLDVSIQKRYGLGCYGLTLTENQGTYMQATIDSCKFVTLVDCTCEEDDFDIEDNVSTDKVINLDSGDISTGGDTPDGVGISSIEQIEESTESEGKNILRITMTNGTHTDFVVRNGKSVSDELDTYKCTSTTADTSDVKELSIDNFKRDENGKPFDRCVIVAKLACGNTADSIKVNINQNGERIPVYLNGEPFSYSCSIDTIIPMMYNKDEDRFEIAGNSNYHLAWE